jgi:hypothetical protein
MSVVASGTVTVRCLDTGAEWDEMVEVFERDLDWAEERGLETCVEDEAREAAVRQAEPAPVETLDVDIS